MAVRLRLTRMGRKKRPYYRIVAVDSRAKRDGAFIEMLGHYRPLEDPPGVDIDAEKALKWLRVGAQPTDTVRSLLRQEGVWLRFRLEKRGLPENQIEQMMAEWFAAQSRRKAEKPPKWKKPAETAVSKEVKPEITEKPAVEPEVALPREAGEGEKPVEEAETASEVAVEPSGEPETALAREAGEGEKPVEKAEATSEVTVEPSAETTVEPDKEAGDAEKAAAEPEAESPGDTEEIKPEETTDPEEKEETA